MVERPLRRSVVLAILVLPWLARAAEEPPRRTIAVVGHAEVKQPPDRVDVSFAVETTAAQANEAVADNAKRSAAVSSAVKKLLAASDTLATTGYAIEPRYEPERPGEQRQPHITGYVVRNEVQVRSQEIDRVGALLDAAAAAGANRVNGIRFLLANRSEPLRAAIEAAAGDAKAQADSMARGLGVQLGRVLSATTSNEPVPTPRRFEAMAMTAGAPAPTPIEAGDVTVSATVQVTYEIQ